MASAETREQVRQYIKIEAKRFLHILPGFMISLLTAVLLAAFFVFLAGRLLPEALEVKPFQVGLYMEGEDFASAAIREYVNQMESTERLVEFREISSEEIDGIRGISGEERRRSSELYGAFDEGKGGLSELWETSGIEQGELFEQRESLEEQETFDQKMQAMLEREELTACIIVPERTVQSIMDGTNIPVQVIMSEGVDNTERYLQKRLLTQLTECGATLIDVPQAETLLLYEMQIKDPEEMGRILDLFHLGLVLERENWFEKETVSAFETVEIKEYYLSAGLTLVLLLWGAGVGGFLGTRKDCMMLLLERQGIPLLFQRGVKQFLFFLWYLAPFLVLMILVKDEGLLIPGLLCGVMLTMQYSFFFEAAPTVVAGVIMSVVWGLVGFFGAGGFLPAVFLPGSLTEICGRLPGGICMEVILQSIAGGNGTGGKFIGYGFLWCLIFGAAGQLVFSGKQRKYR